MRYFLAVLLLASLASAHGIGGGENKVVGPYEVDFGYDSYAPTAGERMLVSFSLYNSSDGAPVQYTSVFVMINKGGELVFSGSIAHDYGAESFFTYTFADGGVYNMSARFYDGPRRLAETSFALGVAGADSTESTAMIIVYGLLVAAAFAILYTWNMRRKKKR